MRHLSTLLLLALVCGAVVTAAAESVPIGQFLVLDETLSEFTTVQGSVARIAQPGFSGETALLIEPSDHQVTYLQTPLSVPEPGTYRLWFEARMDDDAASFAHTKVTVRSMPIFLSRELASLEGLAGVTLAEEWEPLAKGSAGRLFSWFYVDVTVQEPNSFIVLEVPKRYVFIDTFGVTVR